MSDYGPDADIDLTSAQDHHFRMEEQVVWTGAGRWLSFAGAGILFVSVIPAVFVTSLGAAAGWNIFLGLLLFGAIASGSKSAPKVALVIAISMLVRLSLATLFWEGTVEFLLQLLTFGLIAFAAYDMMQQAQAGDAQL